MAFMSKRHLVLYIFTVSFISVMIFSFFTYSQTSIVERMRLEKMNREAGASIDVQKFIQLDKTSVPISEEKGSKDRPNPLKNNKTSFQGSGSLKETGDLDGLISPSSSKNYPQLVNYDTHVFYYPWFKNPTFDGGYAHWDHELIPHWTDKSSKRKRKHTPPGDIGANYYPRLGPYSSKDPSVVHDHMKLMRDSGIGVVVVSWYPPQHQKDTETPVDSLMPLLFDIAHNHSLKVAFHVEPYEGRSGATLKEVMQYMMSKYGTHPAFYRRDHNGKQLPVVYIYDSYQIDAKEWAEALKPTGSFTVRGTDYDAIFIGLLVERQHFGHLIASGFDGFYTYFASNGFSYGSTWKNWPFIAKEAAGKNLIFVPSIGPGYIDTRVREWNGKNTKSRLHGEYYRASFDSAMKVKPRILSITSFNEWHEGTQIEPAVPKINDQYKYEDYQPASPEFYMELTKQFVLEYHRNMSLFGDHEHDDSL